MPGQSENNESNDIEAPQSTPSVQSAAAVSSLRHAVEPGYWIGDAIEAARKLAVYRVSELDSWRNGNGLKADALYRAVAAGTAGVALITAGILIVLF